MNRILCVAQTLSTQRHFENTTAESSWCLCDDPAVFVPVVTFQLRLQVLRRVQVRRARFCFSACNVDRPRIIPGWVLCELIQSLLSTLNGLTDRILSLLQLLAEVGDLLLRKFGVIAHAISSLHRVDEDIGRHGSGWSHIEGIVSLAQPCHRSVEAIELCALRSESGRTAHFDSYFDDVVRLAIGMIVVSVLPSKFQPPFPTGPACFTATPLTVIEAGGQSAGSFKV